MPTRSRFVTVLSVLACALAVVVATSSAATKHHAEKPAKCHTGFVRSKGHCVCPKGKVRKGAKCVKKTATTPSTKPGTTPTPVTTTPGQTTPAPLFTPPGKDLTGTPAAQAIVPYLTNSTFTSCVAGFPNCPVEERYGHFANGTMFYCRLTPTSGSDIINAGHAYSIVGADMKADGSWAVTLQVISYGDALTYYTWTVSTSGAATALYWGPGSNPQTDSPSQQISGLRWVRGARDCSY